MSRHFIYVDSEALLRTLITQLQTCRYQCQGHFLTLEDPLPTSVVDFLATHASHVDHLEVREPFIAQNLRVAVFDMDSTLIENECLDDLAHVAGVGLEVAQVTEKAMQGHYPFTQSITERALLLKGHSACLWQKVRAGIRFQKGVAAFISFLKHQGVATYIVSGGFDAIAREVAKTLGMTGFVCNHLVTRDGVFTGEVTGPAGGEILDADGKRRALEVIAMLNHASLKQCLAMGDGANDIPMITHAGMGIAYRAKPIVQAATPLHVHLGGYPLLQYAFEAMHAPARIASSATRFTI